MIHQIGTYKGRKYKVLFIGQTKFGLRAHLQFFNGAKDFWVDANKVYLSSRAESGSVCCKHCGKMTAEGDDWCMACGQADYE